MIGEVMTVNHGISFLFLILPLTGCVGQNKPQGESQQLSNNKIQVTTRTVIQDLCWSPTGRYIYFSAMRVKPDFSDYSPELWTVYRFDTGNRSTAIIAKSALNVAVSPSGDQLAVAKNDGDKRSIFILDEDGKNPIAVPTGEAKTSAPAWSPDGKYLAITSTIRGSEEIYSVRISDYQITKLTDSRGYKAYSPAWSPDGKHITYYLEKGDGQDQIYVMKADGTQNRNVTNDSLNNIFPGWMDNNTIIYGQGHKNGRTRAFQISIDGTNKMQVLQLESMYARYSPYGSYIAYIDEHEGNIKVISANGKPLYGVEVQ